MKQENKEITTWEQLCAATGRAVELPFDVSALPEEDQRHLKSAYKLPLIIEHFREGEKLDYSEDNDQRKYEPIFEVLVDDSKPSGFALSYYDFDFVCVCSHVGLRFAHLSVEALKHCVTHFLEDYENVYLKKQ